MKKILKQFCHLYRELSFRYAVLILQPFGVAQPKALCCILHEIAMVHNGAKPLWVNHTFLGTPDAPGAVLFWLRSWCSTVLATDCYPPDLGGVVSHHRDRCIPLRLLKH